MSDRKDQAAGTPSTGSSEGATAAELGAWLDTVFAYKWLVLACVVAGGMLAFVWSKRQPKVYEAVCSIQHVPDPPRPLGRKVEGLTTPFAYWSNREHFTTQNQIIGSRTVAERVVTELGLHHDTSFVQTEPGMPPPTVTDVARKLQGALTVSPEKRSRLVHVHIEDTDPERAALLANAIADAYIAKTMEDRLGSTTAALEWLGQQLEGLKSQLESSELALHDFKERHNVLSISLEDRQNIVANNIQQYSEALTAARSRRIEVRAKLDALRAANAEDPFSVHAEAADESSAVAAIRTETREVQREMVSLSVEYGDSHPKMLALSNRVELLREQLREEIDGIIGTAETNLNEALAIEQGLRGALRDSNEAGLALNLREIEYRRLVRARDNTDRLYNTVLERTAETDLTRALKLQFVQIVDRAIAPTASIRPRVTTNVALGGVLGLVVGVLGAMILSRMDRVIRTVETAEDLGLTVLGILPSIESASIQQARTRRSRRRDLEKASARDMIVHTHPRSAVAECCRTIRTNFTFVATDKPLELLVVTSAGPREGKTTVSINLAISLAQSGKRVVLVDTDLRRPRVHRALGLRARKGVTTVLAGEDTIQTAVQATEVPGLSLLSSGPIPPNPAELLHTQKFRDLLNSLRDAYDIVLLDSPPLTAVTDAAVIAPQVDGVIFVINSGIATRDAVMNARRQLNDVGANLIGAVLNAVDLNKQKQGYGAYYYYRREGYYAESSDVEERPAAES